MHYAATFRQAAALDSSKPPDMLACLRLRGRVCAARCGLKKKQVSSPGSRLPGKARFASPARQEALAEAPECARDGVIH